MGSASVAIDVPHRPSRRHDGFFGKCLPHWSVCEHQRAFTSLPPRGQTLRQRGNRHPQHIHTMFASQPPEGWMAECREQWLNRLRKEPPTDQAAPSQHTTFMAAAPCEHAGARSQTWHPNFAAAPWENAGNPLLAGCSRPRCGSCGILLKTGELECPICPRRASGRDESMAPESPGSSGAAHVGSATGEDMAELRRKRRKVQMRLVSLRRGDVRPRPGEPASLVKIVAELDAVALRLRGSDGKFATKS